MTQTSREAWHLVKPDVGRRQKNILDAMLEDRFYMDFTSMELAMKLGIPRDTVSPRLPELARKGLIIVEKVRPLQGHGIPGQGLETRTGGMAEVTHAREGSLNVNDLRKFTGGINI